MSLRPVIDSLQRKTGAAARLGAGRAFVLSASVARGCK